MAGHEPVGIGPGVAMARQPRHPVRREQPERIPALAPPALGDPPALEHDVRDAARREAVAHRQAGLAGADDQDIRPGHGGGSLCKGRRAPAGRRPGARQPASISIETGQPLVSTS